MDIRVSSLKVLVIIPAFNEQDNISQVISDLKNSCPQYDYLVVNDCSMDGTKSVLKERNATYINLPVNLGIGGAVQTGYKYAKDNCYDIAIQMDGDGQHNPQYVEKIIAPILKGEVDSVIGSRFIDKTGFQSSSVRRIGICLLSNLIRLVCGVKIFDVTSGFRAVNKKGIELFAKEYAQDYPEPEAIVFSALKGISIKEVPVIMKERAGGMSSISGIKSIYYMLKVSIAILITRVIWGGN